MEGEGKIVCRQMAPAAVTRHPPGPCQPVATDPFLQTVTTGALILLIQSYPAALAKHLSSQKIEKPRNTLNLGYKGHWNLAELVLTLILLIILTTVVLTQSLTLIYQPQNLVRHHCKFVFLSKKGAVIRKYF